MTVQEFSNQLKKKLKDIYPINEISSITKIILEDIFSISKIQSLTNPDMEIPETGEISVDTIIGRLSENEPVQYITGRTEFYNLSFEVNKSVLIPRPETEELVDMIVKENEKFSGLKVLDLGTGSGCIAVCLAKNLKDSEVFGIDISEKAIETAKFNAERNNLSVNFIVSDILNQEIDFPDYFFDIIVSNPPYIRESEIQEMKKNVLDYEPYNALFVKDSNPLIFYQRILKQSSGLLKPGGKVYFEINENLSEELSLLQESKDFTSFEFYKDMFGKYRIAKYLL